MKIAQNNIQLSATDNYYHDGHYSGTPMQPAPWVRPWLTPPVQPAPLPPLPLPQTGRWKCPDCGHWISNAILDHACARPWGWQPQPYPWRWPYGSITIN